ncbi:MAG: hypothetical protein NT027_17165 [Proteobacteria bacterium]|nr:hypothetical protein [Pseudomonadota bacterium]
MLKKFLVSTAMLFASLSANAEQVTVASTQNASTGRYLGTAVYNGTNTECTIFANPVLAVGPIYGLVNINGGLFYSYYYNCYEMARPQPRPRVQPQRRLFDAYGLASCPAPQYEGLYCPAWVDPMYQACSEVGGRAVGCPGSCTVLCDRPVGYSPLQ